MDEQQNQSPTEEEEDDLKLAKEEIIVPQVYLDANTTSYGTINALEKGYCSLMFTPSSSMKVDNLGLIHSGYLVSSAMYAAMLAVNEPTAIPLASHCDFFAPFELGNTIEFRAQMLQNDTKKREVQVDGFVLDIKVFQALFEVAIFEHHVFKLQITGPKNFDD